MTAQLSREDVKELRNSFQCWQQDYDPKEDAEQYEMFGRAITATNMLLAGMDSEPVAVPDEREAFEAWVKFHLDDEHSIVTLHRANGGLNYRDPHVDLAWIAWKESRAVLKAGPVTAATVPDGWTSNCDADAALVMLDRIDTIDCADDERIESVKNIIRRLAAAPEQEV